MADGGQDPKRIVVPPGNLASYYGDISSGLVVPENMRIEDLTFMVTINPLGQVVFETQKITLISRFNFAFRRAIGWVQDPDLAGAAPSLVSFNILEQGRDFSVFKRPVPMQSLVARSGAGNPAEFDGVYITIPGTDLAVNWTVNSQAWPGLVGAQKTFGVQLIGDYVVCRGN